jgi:16S rRNA (cytosine967-C5)-methyltransferase
MKVEQARERRAERAPAATRASNAQRGSRASQLRALTDALAEVLPLGEPADALLHRFFRAHPQLGQRNRAFVADGVFAALRRLRTLSVDAGTGDARGIASHPRRIAVLVGLRELGLSLREIADGLSAAEREWALQMRAHGAIQRTPAERAELPDWLWQRLGEAFDDADRDALTRAWLMQAPLDLRINPLKTTRDAMRARLADEGIAAEPTPYSPLGLRIAGRRLLAGSAPMTAGEVEVQDEGSQLLGFLVAPRRNEMVVDFCAGAGGKTLLLGALMRSQGRLYAFDVSATRLARLKPRLARSGLSNVEPVVIEHERDTRVRRLAGKIDRVLVDAPCSGFGTLRRNPDLKWRQTPAAIAELADKQQRILAAAATLVKPGGRVVYATCSVLPEENDAIVERFLEAHRDFTLGDASAEFRRAQIALDTGAMLKVYPHRQRCDGFFAAILERGPSRSVERG